MGEVKIVSQQYFKYDQSDYAKSLRKTYGEDGYKKYTAKMNSIMAESKETTNPIAESKKKYTKEKELQYKAALANLKKASNIWNDYKPQYYSNLTTAKANNNGVSLTGIQKQSALQNSGEGAVTAFRNYNEAQAEVDFALSLYNDATHSGMNFLS